MKWEEYQELSTKAGGPLLIGFRELPVVELNTRNNSGGRGKKRVNPFNIVLWT
jgi:hypothetical protein